MYSQFVQFRFVVGVCFLYLDVCLSVLRIVLKDLMVVSFVPVPKAYNFFSHSDDSMNPFIQLLLLNATKILINDYIQLIWDHTAKYSFNIKFFFQRSYWKHSNLIMTFLKTQIFLRYFEFDKPKFQARSIHNKIKRHIRFKSSNNHPEEPIHYI